MWNAVDEAEKQANAQTARRFIIALPKELSQEENIALIQQYCQKQFVDRGMIVDIAVHDSGDGNPHAHVMLTMRSMDEHGKWNPKTKTSYVLDDNGNRIPDGKGKWLRQRVDTVDWNDKKYCEIWRHEWEVQQNKALEKAGRQERIDMRSFRRQGIDMAPQVHLGPAAAAMERKGIQTELGNTNREVKRVNSLLSALKKTVQSLSSWLNELREKIAAHKRIETPEQYPLTEVLFSYLQLRKMERQGWSDKAKQKAGTKDFQALSKVLIFLDEHHIRTVNDLASMLNETGQKLRDAKAVNHPKEQRIRDIEAIIKADKTIRELGPILEKYNGIFFKGAKERYGKEHAQKIDQAKKAQWLLHKLNVTLPINKKLLTAEAAELRAQIASSAAELESIQAELEQLKTIRYWVRKVIPDVLKTKAADGKQSIEEQLESKENKKELEQLLARSAEEAIRQQEEREKQEQFIKEDQRRRQENSLKNELS